DGWSGDEITRKAAAGQSKPQQGIMKRRRQHINRFLVAVVISVTFLSSVVSAHEGLHEQIVAITAKIRLDPTNASLFLKRGELHRLHRDWRRAAADYNRAARLAPQLHVV